MISAAVKLLKVVLIGFYESNKLLLLKLIILLFLILMNFLIYFPVTELFLIRILFNQSDLELLPDVYIWIKWSAWVMNNSPGNAYHSNTDSSLINGRQGKESRTQFGRDDIHEDLAADLSEIEAGKTALNYWSSDLDVQSWQTLKPLRDSFLRSLRICDSQQQDVNIDLSGISDEVSSDSCCPNPEVAENWIEFDLDSSLSCLDILIIVQSSIASSSQWTEPTVWCWSERRAVWMIQYI